MSNLSSSELRVLLLQAGAMIDENQCLTYYQVPKKQGNEFNRHFLTKMMIFRTARDLNYYPFVEVPVHNGMTDLLIMPIRLYVQVEYCQNEIQVKSRQDKYYNLFNCKNYDAELLVVNYRGYPTRERRVDTWHHVLANQLGLQNFSLYHWRMEQKRKEEEQMEEEYVIC